MARLVFEPNSPQLQEAKKLWNKGLRDSAVELFLKARKAEKNNIAAILDTARALGASYRYTEAERELAKLRSHLSSFPVLYLMIGQIYREIRRPSKALEYFNKAIALIPNSVDPLIESAQMLERFGKYSEASDHVNRVLKLQSNNLIAKLFKARLLTYTGEKKTAIQCYNEVINNSDISSGLKSRALHELGRILDKENPNAAIEMIQQGNFLLSSNLNGHLKQGLDSVELALQLGKLLTPEDLSAVRKQLSDNDEKKIIFSLGFARSGTTLVEKLLSARIAIHDAEELDLFGIYIHPLLVGTLKNYDSKLDETGEVTKFLRNRYISSMSEYFGWIDDNHWILDKNPSHTIICASLARLFPEAKFLVSLRDPRDTLLSAYYQYLPLNPESAAFLNWDTLVQRYVDTMQAWIDLRGKLPKDNWLEVRYEELVEKPKELIESLVDWLGDTQNNFKQPSTHHYVSSPSFADVRKPINTNRVGRWKNDAYKELFSDKTKEKLANVMNNLGYKW